jgi:hypothetical protein
MTLVLAIAGAMFVVGVVGTLSAVYERHGEE